MSAPSSEYVAVYDISNNKERRRVEKCLKGFGLRIQKSVFECRMRKRDLSELSAALGKLNVTTGFVKVYRLEYDSAAPVFGQDPGGASEDNAAFVL